MISAQVEKLLFLPRTGFCEDRHYGLLISINVAISAIAYPNEMFTKTKFRFYG